MGIKEILKRLELAAKAKDNDEIKNIYSELTSDEKEKVVAHYKDQKDINGISATINTLHATTDDELTDDDDEQEEDPAEEDKDGVNAKVGKTIKTLQASVARSERMNDELRKMVAQATAPSHLTDEEKKHHEMVVADTWMRRQILKGRMNAGQPVKAEVRSELENPTGKRKRSFDLLAKINSDFSAAVHTEGASATDTDLSAAVPETLVQNIFGQFDEYGPMLADCFSVPVFGNTFRPFVLGDVSDATKRAQGAEVEDTGKIPFTHQDVVLDNYSWRLDVPREAMEDLGVQVLPLILQQANMKMTSAYESELVSQIVSTVKAAGRITITGSKDDGANNNFNKLSYEDLVNSVITRVKGQNVRFYTSPSVATTIGGIRDADGRIIGTMPAIGAVGDTNIGQFLFTRTDTMPDAGTIMGSSTANQTVAIIGSLINSCCYGFKRDATSFTSQYDNTTNTDKLVLHTRGKIAVVLPDILNVLVASTA